ncbi:MAG TPA: FIST N-terminal domain-containing protein [Pirellulales bacterium]
MTSTTTTAMRCAAALSTADDATTAIAEVCSQALGELGEAPDFGVVFVSYHHRAEFEKIVADLSARLPGVKLIGCTGEAIIGGAREIEAKSAISLWLARMPGAVVHTMSLEYQNTPDGDSLFGWPDDLPETWPEGSVLVAFGDPFTFPAEALLSRLNQSQPGVPVVGGMASGGWEPGQVRLVRDGQVLTHGAVAAWISGAGSIRTITSQGCRPIGKPLVVTKAEGNVIHELSGRSALLQLQEVFAQLSLPEQQLVRRGLHLGQVMNEMQETFGRGDFLIRNVVDVDAMRGSLAIGDYVRVGRTVQFHLRDADSAEEDLRLLLEAEQEQGSPPVGALLFSCNGRGTRLFSEHDHDSGAMQKFFPGLPVAGFFAQGELGPVSGKNYLHGFTASVVLFGP